ncbi:MAG: nucleoside deaminase [Thermodesulfobacteriota bacterium]
MSRHLPHPVAGSFSASKDKQPKKDKLCLRPRANQSLLPPAGWHSWREAMSVVMDLAARAGKKGEVPVAAAVLELSTGKILGWGQNSGISDSDPTAHAEINAIRQAARTKANYRLPGTVLVVTLEPCIMCLGAMVQARISGLVFGAFDPKAGAIISCLDYMRMDWLNNRFWVLGGILQNQSAALLQGFFRRRRNAER